MIYTWEQRWYSLWFTWKWTGRICKYLYKYQSNIEVAVHSQENNNCSANFRKFSGIQLWWSTILVKLQAFILKFIKTGHHHRCFPENCSDVSIAIFIYLWTAASEFTDNSHSFYLFLAVPLVWEDKEEGGAGSSELPWSYNKSMELRVQNLVANNALIKNNAIQCDYDGCLIKITIY